MQRRTQIGIAGGLVFVATALGVAIVSRQSSAADLERRLALMSDSTALDLALQSRDRTQFVSAIERNDAETAPSPEPDGKAAVRRPTRAAPVASPARARVAAPKTTEVASTETAPVASPSQDSEPAPIETPAQASPAPAPSADHIPAPRPTPSRKGGYWSTADVIRNAPFPINP